MGVILDELGYAENLLKNGFVSFMSYKDLAVLAKYYFYLGLEKDDIRNKLEEFCYKFNSEFNDVLFANRLDMAVSSCKYRKIRIPVTVEITKDEIERIQKINNYRFEKILFVLLCCAKHEKKMKMMIDGWVDNGKYYVNKKIQSATIFSLSKVHAGVKEQGDILNYFKDGGYLAKTLPYRGDGAFQILFGDSLNNENDVAIIVTDLNNIVSFYPPYCLICKTPIYKTGSRHTMCKDCQKKERKENVKNNVRKHRSEM